jgi:hypothetical protein
MERKGSGKSVGNPEYGYRFYRECVALLGDSKSNAVRAKSKFEVWSNEVLSLLGGKTQMVGCCAQTRSDFQRAASLIGPSRTFGSRWYYCVAEPFLSRSIAEDARVPALWPRVTVRGAHGEDCLKRARRREGDASSAAKWREALERVSDVSTSKRGKWWSHGILWSDIWRITSVDRLFLFGQRRSS